ncbi:MAG: iron-containing alcohol dehydrogenase, partial [Lentisphaeria bacterium]|nr:iron-containing alcohol dehydrogenase [Lentisphaeria bacterium]
MRRNRWGTPPEPETARVVTDRFLFNSGAVENITDVLDEMEIDHQMFFDVKPDPTLATIDEALTMVKTYEPDVIIALGGG